MQSPGATLSIALYLTGHPDSEVADIEARARTERPLFYSCTLALSTFYRSAVTGKRTLNSCPRECFLKLDRPASVPVHARAAFVTKVNQIQPRIITGAAAKLFVLDLKVGHGAARLACPTVAR